MKKEGYLYLGITTFLFSLGGVLVKSIDLNALALNGYRSLIALLMFVFVLKKTKFNFNKYEIIGALGLVLTNVLFIKATQLTTAVNAIVLQYSAPIYVLIFKCISTRKLPRIQDILVIGLTFLGLIIFFVDDLTFGMMLGNLYALLAGVCFSFVFIVNNFNETDSFESIKLAFLLGFIVGLPQMINSGSLDLKTVILVMIMGVFQLGLAYKFFAEGIKLVSSFEASIICLFEAVLNPLLVLLFINERPSLLALCGAFIVLLAIFLNINFNREV